MQREANKTKLKKQAYFLRPMPMKNKNPKRNRKRAWCLELAENVIDLLLFYYVIY